MACYYCHVEPCQCREREEWLIQRMSAPDTETLPQREFEQCEKCFDYHYPRLTLTATIAQSPLGAFTALIVDALYGSRPASFSACDLCQCCVCPGTCTALCSVCKKNSVCHHCNRITRLACKSPGVHDDIAAVCQYCAQICFCCDTTTCESHDGRLYKCQKEECEERGFNAYCGDCIRRFRRHRYCNDCYSSIRARLANDDASETDGEDG